jgi:hypothetical protein
MRLLAGVNFMKELVWLNQKFNPILRYEIREVKHKRKFGRTPTKFIT